MINCVFAEKVSMLVDGELPESEIRHVREHIASCAECAAVENDFLLFREQIKESANSPLMGGAKAALFAPQYGWSFFRRKDLISISVLTVCTLLLVGSGIWLLGWKFNRTAEPVAESSRNEIPVKTVNTKNDFSIARFDKGGRAEIFITPREAEVRK